MVIFPRCLSCVILYTVLSCICLVEISPLAIILQLPKLHPCPVFVFVVVDFWIIIEILYHRYNSIFSASKIKKMYVFKLENSPMLHLTTPTPTAKLTYLVFDCFKAHYVNHIDKDISPRHVLTFTKIVSEKCYSCNPFFYKMQFLYLSYLSKRYRLRNVKRYAIYYLYSTKIVDEDRENILL